MSALWINKPGQRNCDTPLFGGMSQRFARECVPLVGRGICPRVPARVPVSPWWDEVPVPASLPGGTRYLSPRPWDEVPVPASLWLVTGRWLLVVVGALVPGVNEP